MNRAGIAVVGALMSLLVIAPAAPLKRVDAKRAESLFEQYLRKQKLNPDHYGVSLEPFGKYTTLIYATRKFRSPSTHALYIMNARGEIRERSVDSLNVAYMNEFSSCPTPEARMKAMKSYIAHYSDYGFGGAKIINGVADIPGYAKAPLDEDLESAIRPPWQRGKDVHVLYAYRRIGGGVQRYRFTFENGLAFRSATVLQLGRNIGDAQYLE